MLEVLNTIDEPNLSGRERFMNVYPFGFLAYSGTYKFFGGHIVPCDRFDDAKDWVAKHAHKDGFLYPPAGSVRTEEGEPVPNTNRPAHLFHPCASHNLQVNADARSDGRDRTDAQFIIQLVAYLHRTWLQFEDWWFDARVPLSRYDLSSSQATNEHFLSHAYQAWQQWPDRVRKRFVNVLIMFNRAPSYEWDWEHFVIEFMAVDAFYRTAVELTMVPEVKRHAERIDRICQTLGLRENAPLSKELVRLRNDLFHETLWDNGQPGTAVSGAAFMSQFHLRRLNQRLVPAILGYNNEFVRSNWWTSGAVAFTMPSGTGS